MWSSEVEVRAKKKEKRINQEAEQRQEQKMCRLLSVNDRNNKQDQMSFNKQTVNISINQSINDTQRHLKAVHN